MSDKVFSDSTFTPSSERYVDSWNEFSTLNMQPYIENDVEKDDGIFATVFQALLEGLSYIIVAVLIVILIIILYRQRDIILQFFSSLSFRRKQKSNTESAASDTNIFGHDYDFEIAECIRNGQYSESIRLVYLKTLFYLHRHNCISWDESKTATEYFYEYSNPSRRQLFYEMISLYLVAVYGDNENRPISEADYKRARELNQMITNI